MITVRFDGLFKNMTTGNNATSQAGILCYGWLIIKQGSLVAQGHGAFAHGSDTTSNVAEYLALIEGLDASSALMDHCGKVKVIGDAKTVIDQMKGISAVNSERVWPLYRQAKDLAKCFDYLTWVWTPTKNNKASDRLSRRAMKQVRSDEGVYDSAIQIIAPDKGIRRRKRKLLPLLDLRIYGRGRKTQGLWAWDISPSRRL
jgi:ribonuclease HI